MVGKDKEYGGAGGRVEGRGMRNDGDTRTHKQFINVRKSTSRPKMDPDFGWQTRFHDHIIRDKNAYDNITRYIINNPNNWNP